MRAFSYSSLIFGLSPSLCVCKAARKGWEASAGQSDVGHKTKVKRWMEVDGWRARKRWRQG